MFTIGQEVICSGFTFWIVETKEGGEYIIRNDRGTKIAYECEMQPA